MQQEQRIQAITTLNSLLGNELSAGEKDKVITKIMILVALL